MAILRVSMDAFCDELSNAQRAMSKQIKTHTTLPELTLALVQ